MSVEAIPHQEGVHVLRTPESNLAEMPRRRRSRPPEVSIVPEAVRLVDPIKATPAAVGGHEVLGNLYRVGVQESQAAAGLELVKRVRENPNIQTVAFLGPPGVGKSTVIEQFIEALFAEAGGEIAVRITSFDPAFQRMIKHTPREFWDKFHWKIINDSLYITSKERRGVKKKGRRTFPAREVQIIEVPFVGRKATSDRGRSFVESTWSEYVQNGNPEAMLFVPFAPIESATKKSIGLREELAQAKGKKEQIAVLVKYGIEVAADTLKKTGEVIDALIHQILNSANKKQHELVVRDMRAAMREELPELSYGLLEQLVPLPPEANIPNNAKASVRRYVFYWEKTLDEMGVPSDKRYIMLNPPLSRVHRAPVKASKKAKAA